MSPSPSSQKDENVLENGAMCHSLPCNIHYDGLAPVASFFNPTPIDTSNEMKSEAENIKKENNSDRTTVMAAQFRGRGLLATPTPLPSNISGVVVETSTNTSTPRHPQEKEEEEVKGTIKVLSTFDSMAEWHHEHDVDKVVNNVYVKEGSTVYRAEKWCDLARAIHDPIL